VFWIDEVTPLAGNAYQAQLYAGPQGTFESSLSPVSEPETFLTGGLAGYFNGPVVQVPSVFPGQVATLQVRVWELAAGPKGVRGYTAVPSCSICVLVTRCSALHRNSGVLNLSRWCPSRERSPSLRLVSLCSCWRGKLRVCSAVERASEAHERRPRFQSLSRRFLRGELEAAIAFSTNVRDPQACPGEAQRRRERGPYRAQVWARTWRRSGQDVSQPGRASQGIFLSCAALDSCGPQRRRARGRRSDALSAFSSYSWLPERAPSAPAAPARETCGLEPAHSGLHGTRRPAMLSASL
jgi:hypothetical protein